MRRKVYSSSLSIARFSRLNISSNVRRYVTDQVEVGVVDQAQVINVQKDFNRWLRWRQSFKIFGLSVPKFSVYAGVIGLSVSVCYGYALGSHVEAALDLAKQNDSLHNSFEERMREYMQVHIQSQRSFFAAIGIFLAQAVTIGAFAYIWVSMRTGIAFAKWNRINVSEGKPILEKGIFSVAYRQIRKSSAMRALIIAPLLAVLTLVPNYFFISWAKQIVKSPDLEDKFRKAMDTLKVEVPLYGVVFSVVLGVALAIQPFIVVPVLGGNALIKSITEKPITDGGKRFLDDRYAAVLKSKEELGIISPHDPKIRDMTKEKKKFINEMERFHNSEPFPDK